MNKNIERAELRVNAKVLGYQGNYRSGTYEFWRNIVKNLLPITIEHVIIFKDAILTYNQKTLSLKVSELFGLNENNTNILSSIYFNMIRKRNVDVNLLYNCCITNRLDLLIHTKHSYHRTYFYNKWIAGGYIIGKTFPDIHVEYLPIPDDNTCPECAGTMRRIETICIQCKVSYCKRCLIFSNNTHICNDCVKIVDPDRVQYKICDKSSKIKNIRAKTRIKRKLFAYMKKDIDMRDCAGNATYEDILLLLEKADYCCYVCNERVLMNFAPSCCYQFSIDRIDESRSHDRDNILISCYYCNCADHPKYMSVDKICPRCPDESGHRIPKNIRHRNEALNDIEMVNRLKLT